MYEAPKITKVGSLRDLTLGGEITVRDQDDTWTWHSWPTGSR
ncbi:hypothetical protein KDY119_02782 [Luteimicrobium xylanilyticum]|uniref:Lasso RiPP family leader peptide-containing protein n=1 Tax=Luteimicrobium xylanilyticum TaxID=1133546 RepID=A0A5P9QFN0_9MICO|nr:hypothetical protein KDY119_02782 [Luteimicrobium xylanilyticum]